MDTEHSLFDYSGPADIFTVPPTEEIAPLVPVTVATYPYPARALDVGALGVICPHADTPVEVRHTVDSCYYAPVGQRGLSMSASTSPTGAPLRKNMWNGKMPTRWW